MPKHMVQGAPAPLLMLPLCSETGSVWRQGVLGDLEIPSVPGCPPAQKEIHTCVSSPSLSLYMQRSKLKVMAVPGSITITSKITIYLTLFETLAALNNKHQKGPLEKGAWGHEIVLHM